MSFCDCFNRIGYRHYKTYIQCRENKNRNVVYLARNIFCFAVFVFFAAARSVFAGVFAASVFVVSDSRHLCRRKQQKRKQRQHQRKHFSRLQKIQKLQNEKRFERSYCIYYKYFLYFYFPDICIQRGPIFRCQIRRSHQGRHRKKGVNENKNSHFELNFVFHSCEF